MSIYVYIQLQPEDFINYTLDFDFTLHIFLKSSRGNIFLTLLARHGLFIPFPNIICLICGKQREDSTKYDHTAWKRKKCPPKFPRQRPLDCVRSKVANIFTSVGTTSSQKIVKVVVLITLVFATFFSRFHSYNILY